MVNSLGICLSSTAALCKGTALSFVCSGHPWVGASDAGGPTTHVSQPRVACNMHTAGNTHHSCPNQLALSCGRPCLPLCGTSHHVVCCAVQARYDKYRVGSRLGRPAEALKRYGDK